MKQARLIWIAIYSITAIVFGWAAYTWIEAINYQPETPEPNPLNKYNFQAKPAGLELSRYQELLAGGLFFARPPASPALPVPQVQFHSELIVYGIVKGDISRAVVGRNGDQETWIVKSGSVVGEETIAAIGANYVEVQNGSGTGKVFLRE